MKSFNHVNATSVDHAVKMAAGSDRAAFMAGGTDLLGVLKSEIRAEYPELLINLKAIPGLDQIEKINHTICLGSACLLSDIVESKLIVDTLPILSRAASKVAFPEIRNMGTIGGNICQDTRCWYYRYPDKMGGRIPCYRKGKGPCLAIKGDNRYHAILGGKKCFASCPSDLAIALGALDAVLLAAGPKGKRQMPILDFFTVTGNSLYPGEMIETIQIPIPEGDVHQVFIKNSIRKSIDFATVSIAVRLELKDKICTDARIILGAVAPLPYRAVEAEKVIVGSSLDERTISAAAQESVVHARPLSRNGYKVQITKKLVEQALTV